MSQKFAVIDDVHLEALGPDEAETPLVYIVFEDYPERQTIPVFAHEIEMLIGGLMEAKAWLAKPSKKGNDG